MEKNISKIITNNDTNVIISPITVLSDNFELQVQKNILRLIKIYLLKNNLLIISSTTDFNTQNFINKLNGFIKEEQLNNLVFLKGYTQIEELLESIKSYNLKKVIGFGNKESDLKMLLMINELGGTSYMLDNLDIKSVDLFSLIMKMIDIKYYNQLSYLFEMHDEEGFKKVRKQANEEALEIFCDYKNGKIKREELLKKIYFYIVCNLYNAHIRIKNKGENLKQLDPEDVNEKLQLIYNSQEVCNIIKSIC